MESSIILENFIVSRSSLHEVITFEQFERFFSSKIPKHTIQAIFDDLVEQRETKLIEPIKTRIEEKFDVPLQDAIDKLRRSQAVSVGRHSVNNLLSRLSKLENVFDTQNESIDNQITNVIQEIETICNEFNDIKYGNAWFRGVNEQNTEGIVRETINSVDKFDEVFR